VTYLTPMAGHRSQGKPYLTTYGRGMTLLVSPVGAQLRVTGVRLPAGYALRLNEMGTRCGSLAHVTGHAAFGGRVVGVAGSHYGLDAGTANLIEVEPVRSLP
jgi:Fe2+ transport system protein FeoA